MDSAEHIVGNSPAHRRALREARLIAPSSATIVIRGESGTGKELFASLIHRESLRKGLLVPVNCAALPEMLVDSLLFGHRRGAFTGASESSPGLIASADGGTLFLDEVAELPLPVQGRLLRVLQQKAVLPVGESRERPVDVRIVAASHQNLRAAVDAGSFREDLYFRLMKFELVLAPLRERGRDVVLIARQYLEQDPELRGRARLSRTAEAELLRYPWPGNVRELQNVLFQVAVRARQVISSRDLRLALGIPSLEPVNEVSMRVLEHVSEVTEASCAELAFALHTPRSTMQRLLQAMTEAGDLVAVGLGKATRYRRPGAGERTLDGRSRVALSIAERDGRITRTGLSSETGLAARTAGRVLAKLVEDGLLVPDGRKGSAVGYVLSAR